LFFSYTPFIMNGKIKRKKKLINLFPSSYSSLHIIHTCIFNTKKCEWDEKWDSHVWEWYEICVAMWSWKITILFGFQNFQQHYILLEGEALNTWLPRGSKKYYNLHPLKNFTNYSLTHSTFWMWEIYVRFILFYFLCRNGDENEAEKEKWSLCVCGL
jgi:hypothetical protein